MEDKKIGAQDLLMVSLLIQMKELPLKLASMPTHPIVGSTRPSVRYARPSKETLVGRMLDKKTSEQNVAHCLAHPID